MAAAVADYGLDIANWTDGPLGWHWRPQPTDIPQLATYYVRRFSMDAHIEPSEMTSGLASGVTDPTTGQRAKPCSMTFTDGFTRAQTTLQN